jgi:hypothetical protein
MPMPVGCAIEGMAKGYPVRPETAPQPECHDCGSLRLTKGMHGPRKCLDCGALLVDDPFAMP